MSDKIKDIPRNQGRPAIRRRLKQFLLMVAPLVTLGFVVALLTARYGKEAVWTHAADQLEVNLWFHGQAISDALKLNLETVSALAATATLKSGERAEILRYLALEEERLRGRIEGLYWNDLQGEAWKTSGESFTTGDRGYMPALLRAERVIAGPLESRATGRTVILILEPVRDPQGRHRGALGATVWVDRLRVHLQTLHQSDTGLYWLATAEGRAIDWPEHEMKGVSRLFAFYQASPQWSSARRLEWMGQEVIAAFTRVELTGWILAGVDAAPKQVSYLADLQGAASLALAVCLAGGLAFAYFSSARMVKPIERLLEAQKRLGAGESEVRIENIPDDEIGALCLSFNEMAARLAEADSNLRRSEQRYQLAAAAALDGLWEWRPQSDEYYLSPRLRKLLDCEAESPIKGPQFWPDRLHPAHRGQVIQARRRHLQEGGAYEVEYRLLCRASEYRWVREGGQAVWNRSGKAVLMVGAINDIQGRKEAEEALRQLTSRLEERVQERTRELIEALKDQEAFTYSVSHDLRSPVRAILGFGRILDHDNGRQLDESGRALLAKIIRNAEQMGSLIDDLLHYAFIGQGKLHVGAVDMSGLAKEVAGRLAEREADRDLDLRIGDLDECQGDVAMLRQVWTNLVSNAFKYTRERETARVEVGCDKASGEVVYFVRDNGIGFEQRYAERIFGVFERLHANNRFRGTGVGLAIVRRVIERHGGRVWARSQPGKQTTFYFTVGAPSPQSRGRFDQGADRDVGDAKGLAARSEGA
ncbi:MAG TPA: ATP-binding protein [Acidobacteriota bacterium]|nr:ATP-binding protein [Acidobacteriota bacterium]